MMAKPILNFDYRKAMAPVLGPRAAMARFDEVLTAARNESVTSIKRLVEFRDNENVPVAIRVACCGMILDRAWGKPHQSVVYQELPPPAPVDFNALTEDELLELERMLKKAGDAGENNNILELEAIDISPKQGEVLDSHPDRTTASDEPPPPNSVNVSPAYVPSTKAPPPEPIVRPHSPGKVLR